MWTTPVQQAIPSSAPVAPHLAPATRRLRPPRRWPAILVFFLLAGLIPETIATNSTSVYQLVHQPFGLLFICGFYGTADIVIREAIIRRPLGLAGKVLMGVAFGFVNEGVVAGTWYHVRPDGYAFVHGIDWSWALSLTVFHVFVSVFVPVYVIDSVFPSLAGASLLKRRGIILNCILFLGFSALSAFAPDHRTQRLAVLLVAVALATLATRLPAARMAFTPGPLLRPPGLWRLRLLGFAAMLLYFVCIYLLPALFVRANHRIGAADAAPALVANLILLGLVGWALGLGLDWSRRPGWSPRQQLALISGALGFSLLFSFLPPLLATWEELATIPFAILLFFLTMRARRDHNQHFGV